MTFGKGYHHGYTGVLLIILGAYMRFYLEPGVIWWIITTKWGTYILVSGWLLVIDEAVQTATNRQYGGAVHWVYVNTLYKIPWVKRFNIWMDSLFGKKEKETLK